MSVCQVYNEVTMTLFLLFLSLILFTSFPTILTHPHPPFFLQSVLILFPSFCSPTRYVNHSLPFVSVKFNPFPTGFYLTRSHTIFHTCAILPFGNYFCSPTYFKKKIAFPPSRVRMPHLTQPCHLITPAPSAWEGHIADTCNPHPVTHQATTVLYSLSFTLMCKNCQRRISTQKQSVNVKWSDLLLSGAQT